MKYARDWRGLWVMLFDYLRESRVGNRVRTGSVGLAGVDYRSLELPPDGLK